MVRVAAIDCGSNSTRLLISNVENGRLQNLLKQHEVTKLSENIVHSNKISDDSKKRFYKEIKRIPKFSILYPQYFINVELTSVITIKKSHKPRIPNKLHALIQVFMVFLLSVNSAVFLIIC